MKYIDPYVNFWDFQEYEPNKLNDGDVIIKKLDKYQLYSGILRVLDKAPSDEICTIKVKNLYYTMSFLYIDFTSTHIKDFSIPFIMSPTYSGKCIEGFTETCENMKEYFERYVPTGKIFKMVIPKR